MREEEHPFERRGRGPSLMRPFILAALMGVGSTLAAIGAIWLMQPSLILKRAPIWRNEDDYGVLRGWHP